MEVGPELALGGRALDGGHHLAADHEAAQIRAAGLLDELLHQQVGVEALEGIDDALGRLLGFGQHHALALGPLQQLHDQGGAAHHADQIHGVERGIGEARDGGVEPGADEFLGGEELVAGGGDRLGTVERRHPHRLELPRHGAAVEGDAGTDAGDDRIHRAEHVTAAVVDLRVAGIQAHVALTDVEEPHVVAPFLPGLDQAAIAVEIGVAGQQHDPQAGIARADMGIEGPALLGAEAAQVVAALRVHQDPAHHRLATEQHPISHGIPVGEGQLHLPALLAEHQPLPDHVAVL